MNNLINGKEFILEALTDFVGEALWAGFEIREDHIRSMMQTLNEIGVKRVHWAYYGDGHGGHRLPDEKIGTSDFVSCNKTYSGLGNPLAVAASEAHRLGMELYAYFKPYEMGVSMVLPEGSREAKDWGLIPAKGGSLVWADSFVAENPDLRVRHIGGEDKSNVPIKTIRLVKMDDAPTRISKEHIQIWVSDENYRYERLPVAFDYEDTVVGQSRILTLSGLNLTDKYILVTTDFTDGPGDFRNAAKEMMIAFDADGNEIEGVFSPGVKNTIYKTGTTDFRTEGVGYDTGWGHAVIALDDPNGEGMGYVAFTRGKNRYLPGALCETEPKVREYWLSCIREIIDAGVDGVDVRVENHSTHTDYPLEYGCNDVVLEKMKDGKTMRQVRGEAYTEFLSKASQMVRSRGKKMRVNMNLDFFRNDPPPDRFLACPCNLEFDFNGWVSNGILDEATVRFFTIGFDRVFEDAESQEKIKLCVDKRVPMFFNYYLPVKDYDVYVEQFRKVKNDGRFGGFILYETFTFLELLKEGGCRIKHPVIEKIREVMNG